jgi:hypothetical protein
MRAATSGPEEFSPSSIMDVSGFGHHSLRER